MPQYRLRTELPPTPLGLPDKEAALVRPLYLAFHALTKSLSREIGAVQYSDAELAELNQLTGLLFPYPRTIYPLAPSALAYGKVVNLYVSAGKIAARYADATDSTKPAHGVVDSPDGIAAGSYGKVILMEGLCQGITGSSLGQYYWLGTNGDIQAVPPSVSGSLRQGIGFGFNAGGFYLNISSDPKVN